MPHAGQPEFLPCSPPYWKTAWLLFSYPLCQASEFSTDLLPLTALPDTPADVWSGQSMPAPLRRLIRPYMLQVFLPVPVLWHG